MISSLALALIAAVVVVQIAIFSSTIYLHRSLTHRAIKLHPVVALFFRMMVWLTTGIVAKQWVAVHRKHHAFPDEEGDPHSPHLAGFWSVQLGNVFHYAREARKPEVVEKYAKDISDDAWDRYLFNHGKAANLLGLTLLCLGLGVGWGLLAGALHAVGYVFILSPSVNGLCHVFGRKNFDNTATNLQSVAFLTAGEGLHNNHHAFQRSPKFSYRPGEFDLAWPVIWVLTKLGLAEPYKTIKEALAQPQ